MPKKTFRIGVIAERRPPVTRWGKPVLRPSAVLAIEPATPPRTRISIEDGVEGIDQLQRSASFLRRKIEKYWGQ
jgi:hypothetical protein